MDSELREMVIIGPPIAWKRPRTKGKRFFDSQVHLKETIRLQATSEGFRPINKPLKVMFEFRIQIPNSWSKKKKAAAEGTYHSGRPDLSNLIKFYEDSLNGIIWEDDALIAVIRSMKIYSFEPKTIITWEEL